MRVTGDDRTKAKKNTKSRYWVDDNSILPEIVITPQGNYPILDEAGNPARTVGAIQDINPNAHIYERVNTQPFMDDYIEGETNAAANQKADALDAQVVPHMGDFVSAATKPLDALMPSRWIGLLDKDYDELSAVDRFSRLFDENNRGLFINDNPYGLFSKRYAEEHPYWAMAGNTAFDIASTPFIWNGANKAYNAGKTAYNTGRNAVRNYNFAKALDADIANTNLVVGEPTGARVITYSGLKTIKISPEELNRVLQSQDDYYFLGHGTGRTSVSPETIFNSGLRIKKGDVSNTTIPVSESNLTNWPHLDSEEVILLPGKVEMSKYDSPYGHIPTDWYDSKTFHWNDNPPVTGSGFFAVQEPHATFVESTKNGIPGIYTKPEAILGSYNTRTNTLQFNPNSQYKFSFGEPNTISWEDAINPVQHKVVTPDVAKRYGIDSGIDIVGATTPQKINFKISDDIIRRLQRLGIDTNKRVYIKAPWNSEETFMLPSEYLKLNMRMPNLLERNPEFVGTYYPRKGTVTLDSTSPQERLYLDLTHERVGHGTEKLVFNYPEAKQVYSDFANPFREFLEPYRLGDNYIIGGQEIPAEYLSDHELRSTIKELEHQIRVSKNPINAKDFERIVDEMPEEELLNMLKTTNAYGLTYYQMRELVEGFADKLKNLIKYAPAAIPVGIVGTNK